MISNQQPSAAAARGGKYLTFMLGNEEYGLEILKVREIIGYADITALPGTASYVKGVMNLRGQVMSVMDLRAKFGMAPTSRTDQTCIIVIEILRDGRKLYVGIIVDRVSEVLWIDSHKIEQTPVFDASVRTDFILGIGMVGGAVKILLDIDRVVSAGDTTAAHLEAA
jgi:purine-binding chemotaxis protein CheW